MNMNFLNKFKLLKFEVLHRVSFTDLYSVAILILLMVGCITYFYTLSLFELVYSLALIAAGGSLGVFISDGFKFSDFTIINTLQKFVLRLIFVLFVLFIICKLIVLSVDISYYPYVDSFIHKIIDFIFPTIQCSSPDNNSDSIGTGNNNISSNSISADKGTSSTIKAGDSVSVTRSSSGNVETTVNVHESTISKGAHIVGNYISQGLTNVGVYAAGATMAKTVYTCPPVSNFSVPARILTAVASGGLMAGTSKVAVQSASDFVKNRTLLEEGMKQSSQAAQTSNNLPKGGSDVSQSLTGFEFDFNFGYNDSMSPIESMIYSIQLINIFMLVSFLIISYLLIIKYIKKYNLLGKILTKILPSEYSSRVVNLVANISNRVENYYNILIGINIFLLIILVLLNIFISTELYCNLDDYVKVYIYVKNIKATIPLIFAIKHSNINKFNPNIKNIHYIQRSFISIDSLNKSTNSKNSPDKNNSDKGVHYWKEFVQETPGGFLTEGLIGFVTKKFYLEIINPTFAQYKNITYCTILKVVFKDGSVRCVSNMVIVTRKNDVNNLVKVYNDFWNLRGDNYHMQEIKKVFISYRTFYLNEVSKLEVFKNKLLNISENYLENNENFEYTGYKLPSTTDLSKWGKKLNQSDGASHLYSPVGRSKTNNILYNIFTQKNKNTVQVFSGDRLMLDFSDILTAGEKNLSTFKRVMKNTTIFFKEGLKVKEIINRKLKFIKPISKDLFLNEKFITLDIETKNIKGQLFPICISLYDGTDIRSFYILDFNSELDMVKAAFNFLNKRKYHYQRVYIHNLSKFDGVFLLKYLTTIGDVKPLMRNQSLYEIKIKLFGESKQKYIIILRDSYLILPSSLSKLSKAFQISNPKTIFPIFAVNELPLNYIGKLPEIATFLSKDDYLKYIKHISPETVQWDLRKELIKYCENDVISLHQVIQKFSNEIFDMFRLDIHKYLTLSSIAFAIYRSNYLSNENNIPKINGQMFKDIYQSYKGGLVDMYIPEGNNLFSFDVNSEYPEAMCKDMPGGNTQFIKGEISLKDPNIFGFYQAEIVAPEGLDMPILPIKYKGRTITALGTWVDWYFTEELRDAEKYGYKIKLRQGYNFQRKNLFKNFVEDLYNIKEKTPKNDPKYAIIKFILNMTYGRFGMKPTKEETVLVSKEQALNYLLDPNKDITEHFVFENNSEFIKYNQNIPEEKSDNQVNIPSVSISIASAVVAYGRMKINMLKHFNNIKTYYSDTDSIFTNVMLPKELTGSKLGQLKLENKIKFGYFIAPKVYCIVTQDNNTICKVKGLNSNMSFYEFNMLLYKNSTISKFQEKWYRKWEEGTIYIRNEIYSLIVTDNKRQLIYDSSSKLVATKPYVYINGEIVNKNVGYILNIEAPKFLNN